MKKSLLKKAVSSILAVTVLSGYGIVSLAEEEEFSDIDVPEETEEIASEDPSDEPFVEEEAFEEEEPSVEEEIIVDAEVADEETEEVLASGVLITTQFPDAKLAECVGESCDRNGDNRLSDDEIALVTTLDCRNWGIKKLDGIEIFTSLKVLKVGMSYTSSGEANTIDVVDITKLPSLEELNCNNAHVWHLYTGDNPNLKELDAGNNSTLWGTLDLTGCTNLEYLNLNVTGLSSVDISN